MPDFGQADVRILPEDSWRVEARSLLTATASGLHVFNTLHADDRISYAAQIAASKRIAFGVMSESRFNAFAGPRYWLKELYWRSILPRRTRPLACRGLFVLSLSGSAPRALADLHRLGWPEDRVFPYGYFSEPVVASHSPVERAAEGPIRLLCTGYLERNKGIHLLLQALAYLRDRHLAFLCHITGFGSMERSLKRLCSSLCLDTHVRFTGVLPTAQLDDAKRAADVFVAPGLCEPWGIRINEAIQAELPVVISDGIGACELIRASGGGAIFRSGDARDLARVLAKLLESPQTRRACRERLNEYRECIHPRVAAEYFLKVVECVQTPGAGAPSVPWLQGHDRGSSESNRRARGDR